MRAGISIGDVARELEVDIDLDSRPDGAVGDLRSYAHVPFSCNRRSHRPRRSSRRRRSPSTPRNRLPAPCCLLPRGVADNLSACPPPIPNPLADSCSPLRAPGTRSALLQHTPPPANGQRLGPTRRANGSLMGPTTNGCLLGPTGKKG